MNSKIFRINYNVILLVYAICLALYVSLVGADIYEEMRLVKLKYYGYSFTREVLLYLKFFFLLFSLLLSILLFIINYKFIKNNKEVLSRAKKCGLLGRTVFRVTAFLCISFMFSGLVWSHFLIFIIFIWLSYFQYLVFNFFLSYQAEHPGVYSLITDVPAAFILSIMITIWIKYMNQRINIYFNYISFSLVICVFLNHIILLGQTILHRLLVL